MRQAPLEGLHGMCPILSITIQHMYNYYPIPQMREQRPRQAEHPHGNQRWQVGNWAPGCPPPSSAVCILGEGF